MNPVSTITRQVHAVLTILVFLLLASTPCLQAQSVDSDGDGMTDAWETLHGLNPNDPEDALKDQDGDRIPNLWESVRGSSASLANDTPNPVYDATVDQSLAADDPVNAQFKSLQAAYDSLTSTIPGYRFTVLVKRGTYSADLDAVTQPKPVAWVAQMSGRNDDGSPDAEWLSQRASRDEGVILDGELASGAGLRFVADTVFDGFIIRNWSHDHLPSAVITTTVPYNFNQKSAITVYAPSGDPAPPVGRIFIVNCIISNWMAVFITTPGWTQPAIGGAMTNYGGDVSLVHCSIIRSLSSAGIGFTQVTEGDTTTTSYTVFDYRTIRNEGGLLKLINTVLWDPDALIPNPGIERVGTGGQNVQLITSIVQRLLPPVEGNIPLQLSSLLKPNLTATGYQSLFVAGTNRAPLRNVGTQTGLKWDIHGEARPTTGTSVDIGADEWVNSKGAGETAVDSLPDWWEFFWFGSLSRTDHQDQDADGVSNLNEYLAGTPPTKIQDLPLLQSLSRTGYAASGTTGLNYSTPAYPAVNGDAQVLFGQELRTTGNAGARSFGIFSTLAPEGTVDLAFQTGTTLTGIGGLSSTSQAVALGSPLCNSPGLGVFLVTASGPGLNSSNNQILIKDDGAGLDFVLGKGQPQAALGGATVSQFSEVLQHLESGNLVIPHQLKLNTTSIPFVTSKNDSGLLLISPSGVLTNNPPREGAEAYGGGGQFGQFNGRAANGFGENVHFSAFLIPETGKPSAAIFQTSADGSSNKVRVVKAGDPAPGAVPATAIFSSFSALTHLGGSALYRAQLKGAAARANDGIWQDGVGLLIQKGATFHSYGQHRIRIGSILKFWPVEGNQVVLHVTLTGHRVTAANRHALLLRQDDGTLQVLMRTGDLAPGTEPARVRAIQAVDVNPSSGHYVVLASIKGPESRDNQALWTGQTTLHWAHRRPKLRLRKGGIYLSTATPLGSINSLSIKPAMDPTGAGGRGLAQVVGSSGHVVVSILTDKKVTEQVLLDP